MKALVEATPASRPRPVQGGGYPVPVAPPWFQRTDKRGVIRVEGAPEGVIPIVAKGDRRTIHHPVPKDVDAEGREGVPPTKKGLFPVTAQIRVDHGADLQDFAGVKGCGIFHLKNVELEIAFLDLASPKDKTSGIGVGNEGQRVNGIVFEKRIGHRDQQGLVTDSSTDIRRVIGVADDFGDFHFPVLGVIKEFIPRIRKFTLVFSVRNLGRTDLLEPLNDGCIAAVPLLFKTQRFGHGFDGFVGEPNNQTQKHEFEDVLEIHKAYLPCNITNNPLN